MYKNLHSQGETYIVSTALGHVTHIFARVMFGWFDVKIWTRFQVPFDDSVTSVISNKTGMRWIGRVQKKIKRFITYDVFYCLLSKLNHNIRHRTHSVITTYRCFVQAEWAYFSIYKLNTIFAQTTSCMGAPLPGKLPAC